MNNQLTPEQLIHKIIEEYDIVPASERYSITTADINGLASAESVLQSRAAEIAELNKLCDRLDAENGKLKGEIARHDAETKEWLLTIRQLQDSMEELRRKTVYLDRVRDVLNMAEFTVNVVSRAYEMPLDCAAMLDNLVAQLRAELCYPPDDDIPF